MKLDVNNLIEQVKIEAILLNKYAKPSELHQLDYLTLEAENTYKCIYGQMTGYCNSLRAGLLFNKCCKFVYCDDGNKTKIHHALKFIVYTRSMKQNIKTSSTARSLRTCNRTGFYTPIEVFISYNQKGKGKKINNKILIDFLKGVTNEVNFV